MGILALFLQESEARYHVREIARRVKTEVNAVRRELSNLVKVGFLSEEPEGNRLYFRINPDFLLLDEFWGLVYKQHETSQFLRERIPKLGSVQFIAVSKGFLRGRPVSEEVADILIVGEPALQVLNPVIQELEQTLGREINYAVLGEADFASRKERSDRFIINALLDPRLLLIGSVEEFYK